MRKKPRSIKIITDKKRVRPGKSEVLRLIYDNSKARKLAGWKPEFTLEQGLTRVIDYMKETKHLYKSDIYNI
jgi:nucleoside-diphosphate-sugar epimerase